MARPADGARPLATRRSPAIPRFLRGRPAPGPRGAVDEEPKVVDNPVHRGGLGVELFGRGRRTLGARGVGRHDAVADGQIDLTPSARSADAIEMACPRMPNSAAWRSMAAKAALSRSAMETPHPAVCFGCVTWVVLSCAAFPARNARLRTPSASTATPAPCSPARMMSAARQESTVPLNRQIGTLTMTPRAGLTCIKPRRPRGASSGDGSDRCAGDG